MRQGNRNIEDFLNQKTETHIISSFVNYGFSNTVSISLSLPFIINRAVNINIDKTETNIGDLSLMFRYFSAPQIFSKPANIQVSVGSTIPVGNGIANVITDEKNFASGTFDPIVNIITAILVRPGWSLDARFYTRQIVYYDNARTKTGDLYSYGVNITYAPTGAAFTVNTQLKFINRGQDIFRDVVFENSGGDYIYLSLGFSHILFGKGESAVRWWSEFDVPLYQYVQGTQLTEKWNVRFGINVGFTIFGHQTQTDTDSIFR